MRTTSTLSALIVLLALPCFAQTAPAPAALNSTPPAGGALERAAGNGCSAASSAPSGTIDQTHHNRVYRLIDEGLKGRTDGRLHVVGGLVPTANVAARAGTLDPSLVAQTWIDPTAPGKLSWMPMSTITRKPTPIQICPIPPR
jgi:hypothetical protein